MPSRLNIEVFDYSTKKNTDDVSFEGNVSSINSGAEHFNDTVIEANIHVNLKSIKDLTLEHSLQGSILSNGSPCVVRKNVLATSTPYPASATSRNSNNWKNEIPSLQSVISVPEKTKLVILNSSDDDDGKNEDGLINKNHLPCSLRSSVKRTNERIASSAESVSSNNDSFSSTSKHPKRKRLRKTKESLKQKIFKDTTVYSSDETVSENENCELSPRFSKSLCGTRSDTIYQLSPEKKSEKRAVSYSPIINKDLVLKNAWLSASGRTGGKRKLRTKKNKEKKKGNFKKSLKELMIKSSSSTESISNDEEW